MLRSLSDDLVIPLRSALTAGPETGRDIGVDAIGRGFCQCFFLFLALTCFGFPCMIGLSWSCTGPYENPRTTDILAIGTLLLGKWRQKRYRNSSSPAGQESGCLLTHGR